MSRRAAHGPSGGGAYRHGLPVHDTHTHARTHALTHAHVHAHSYGTIRSRRPDAAAAAAAAARRRKRTWGSRRRSDSDERLG